MTTRTVCTILCKDNGICRIYATTTTLKKAQKLLTQLQLEINERPTNERATLCGWSNAKNTSLTVSKNNDVIRSYRAIVTEVL